MRRTAKLAIAALLAGLLACAPSSAVAAPMPITVAMAPDRVSMVLGGRFTIETTVSNAGTSSTGALLAHLNVASIAGSVYVDPEDWSAERSRQLELQPGEMRTLTWDIQAVNTGNFAAYVVVLPFGGTAVAGDNLVVSSLVKIDVAPRSTLNARGTLPVVLLTPALLGIVAAGTRLRLRRRQ
jgi:hypothetical protein